MTELAAALRDEIRRQGPITLARYMELALHHPTFGYYRTRDPLGAAGDFTTAPEISQMFGELLGAWLAVVWRQMGAPTPTQLVELGPGRGTLMRDALRASRAAPGFQDAVALHLVETSRPLRERQAAALADAGVAATWHEDIAQVPEGPLLLIANEFFDALPIRQFERTADGWRERLVGVDETTEHGFRLVTSERPVGEDTRPPRTSATLGDVWEFSPAARDIMGLVAPRIAAHGGAALVIDYGSADEAGGDSLQALRDHRRHDPLRDPGSADITAHVDFAALGRVAAAHGARVHGPTTQRDFLLALGLEARAERLRAAALARDRADQASAVATAFKRLIAPTEMGSLFKVLAVGAPNQPAPPGFAEPPPETR